MNKLKKYTMLLGLTAMTAGILTACGKEAQDIGQEKATEIALADAKVAEEDTTRFKVSRDGDNGRVIYEVQFTSGTTEYDYEIQASDGKILEVSTEQTSQPASATPTPSATPAAETQAPQATAALESAGNQQNAEAGITWEEAAALALAKVEGATEQDLRMELEYDDGYQKYEGNIIYNQMEYEFEIDAATGNFLEWSEERD